MNKETTKWTKWIIWFILAIIVVCIYKLLDNFGEITAWISNFVSVIMPFLMAILLAYLFYLPCRKIETIFSKSKFKIFRKKARWLSILVVYLLAILLIIGIIKFVVPNIYESVMELANALPEYYQTALATIEEWPEDFIISKESLESILEELSEIKIENYLNMDTITQYAKGIIGIATTIFDVFVTIVVSIYILDERRNIIKFAKRLCGALFNTKAYQVIGKYFRASNRIFFRFISSQLLDGIVVGILTSIAMSILGVKYAVLLGFMIGLFNLIPYLGAIVAVVIAIIITFLTGGISQAIWMAIVVIIIQQIDANIINPRITGTSLKLSPILIISSVTIIGAYFGVIGMFLAVPIVAIIKLMVTDYIVYKENKNMDNLQ